MAGAQLVKGVRVMDGDVRDHQVGDEQLLEHVRSDVAGFDDLACRAAEKTDCLDRRLDQLLFNSQEIDPALRSERCDDEHLVHRAVRKEPKCFFTFSSDFASATPIFRRLPI